MLRFIVLATLALVSIAQAAPTVVINGGSLYTRSASVTLRISGTTGYSEMCVSNTATCKAYERTGTTKLWAMKGTGNKSVTVLFRGTAGATSATDSIVIDNKVPGSGTLAATYADTANILSWTGFSDALSGIRRYVLVGAEGAAAPACSATPLYSGRATAYRHSGLINGQKYSYRICATDGAGNTTTGSKKTETISAIPRPESDPPTGTVTINGCAAATANAIVTLSVTASDASIVTQMCISEKPTCKAWEAFATTRVFGISKAPGVKTVRLWLRDQYSNASAAPVGTDTIIFDNKPPSGGAASVVACDTGLGLSWYGIGDALTSVASYKVVVTPGKKVPKCTGPSSFTGVALGRTITGLSNGVRYGYAICATDVMGNLTKKGIGGVAIPTAGVACPDNPAEQGGGSDWTTQTCGTGGNSTSGGGTGGGSTGGGSTGGGSTGGGSTGGGSSGGGSSGGSGSGSMIEPDASLHIIDARLPAGTRVIHLGGIPALAAGDEVLVHQAQHPLVAGQYEFATVESVSNTTVTLVAGTSLIYESAVTASAVSAQLVKVVSDTDVTIPIGALWRPPRWTGLQGGVLAIHASHAIIVDGIIDGRGAGFRGGAPGIGTIGGCAYPWPTTAGEAGESTRGASALFAPCSRQANRTGHLNPTPANGMGGGGGGGSTASWNFSFRSGGGGGGGGHLVAGTGGAGSTNNPLGEKGGPGGSAYEQPATVDRLILGAGGGGGARGVNAHGGWGGHGGGAVLLVAPEISGLGIVTADGQSGTHGLQSDDGSGGGGGGAGGTIIVKASSKVFTGAEFLVANGGAGGERGSAQESRLVYGWPNYGTGGNGGAGAAGRVVVEAPVTIGLSTWSSCTAVTACEPFGTQSRNRTDGTSEAGPCPTFLVGSACDDGNAATSGDRCDGFGQCIGAMLTPGACLRPAGPGTCPSGTTPVPGGTYRMGRDTGINLERPAHWVTVDAFCIDTAEPTVGAVRSVIPDAVVNQTVDTASPELSFEQATAYCVGRGGRLPLEAEWEFAARGCDGRTSGPSAFGLLNMLDRGREWVSDFAAGYVSPLMIDSSPADWGHYRIFRGMRAFTMREFVGPIDAGQVIASATPRASVRCVFDPSVGGYADWPIPHPAGSADPVSGALLPNQVTYTVTTDTVVDNVTGLMWQRNVPTLTLNWSDAKAHCEALTLAGHSDWRLPNRMELVSLVDFTRTFPSINETAFPSTPSEGYWSSSAFAGGDTTGAWYVNFGYGYADNFAHVVFTLYRVRCVR